MHDNDLFANIQQAFKRDVLHHSASVAQVQTTRVRNGLGHIYVKGALFLRYSTTSEKSLTAPSRAPKLWHTNGRRHRGQRGCAQVP